MANDSKLAKVTIFLALTTLVISLGASATLEPSDDGDKIKDPLNYTVTLDSGTQVNVSIDGPNSEERTYDNLNEGDSTSDTFSVGSGNSGTYTLTAEDQAGTDEIEVTIDGEGPTFDNIPDYTQGSFSVEVNDNEVGVDNVSAVVSSNKDVLNDTIEKSGCTGCKAEFDIDTDDISNGEEISVDFTAYDTVGNEGSDSASITYDNSYDGDTSPDISLEDADGSNTVILDEGDDQQVNIDISEEDEDTDIKAVCYANGDEIDETDFENPDDGDTEFSCNIEGDEYSGEEVDFEVELCDEAGNCADRVSEDFTFDGERPEIVSVGHPEDVSTFNSEFTVEYVASDDASGIDLLEYTADDNTNYGNGIKVDQDGDGEFTVQVNDIELESGENTLYIRAQDGVGRWSDEHEFNFEYYPDQSPEISLSAPDSLELKSNENTSFTVTVENTGEFLVSNFDITGENIDGFTVGELEPGSSLQEDIKIDASDLEVGKHNLTLTAERFDESTTTELTVRATKSQQQDIQSEVEEQASKMEELEENISKLGSLSEENQKKLDGNVSEFTEKVENAREAVQRGEYYKAKSYLQNIDSSFSQASDTYSEVEKDYRQKMTNRYIMFALFGVLVLGGGTAGFLLYREEELLDGIDVDGGSLPDVIPDDWEIDLPDNIPEIGVMTKAKGLLGNGEDEEQEDEEVGYTFEDFT